MPNMILHTYHIIVTLFIQGRWIRHRPFHGPALGFIFSPNKILDFSGSVSVPLYAEAVRAPLTPPKEHAQVTTLPPNICLLLEASRMV